MVVSVQLIALSFVRTAMPSGPDSLVTQFISQFDSTEPIWSIDPIYIALAGALIILVQLYREGKRQQDTIRKLADVSIWLSRKCCFSLKAKAPCPLALQFRKQVK